MTTNDSLRSPTRLTDTEAERLLIDLVSIASPSCREAAAVRSLVGWMQRHGYDEAFEDDAGNAVGIIGTGKRDLVLLGHIDTFGAQLPVIQRGRLLFGRGAVDAKSALCAFAAAGAQARLAPDIRLIVVGAVEEETATSKGAHFIARHYRPQMCIIGEPSNWDRLTLGYKGRLLTHSAGQADTGAERAFAYWQQVMAYAAVFNRGRIRAFDRLDITLQDIQTGHDGVHAWADMTIGFRLPPEVTPEAVAEALHTQNTVRMFGMERAIEAARDSTLSRAFRAAIRAHGGQPAFVHKTGTSDMNIVGRIWNCPILAYGPGNSALDHTPDEQVDLDEYLRAVSVLIAVLERL
jgi:LysW-gamma-L-lysine carboxypeptidase